MDKRLGWALAVVLVAVGWWQWGWQGVVMAVTVVVFWLLLQFSRALKVMQNAGRAPMGSVANAVMLQAQLREGLTLIQVLPLTGSLGQTLPADPPQERFAWADAAGDRVELSFQSGRLCHWVLVRAEAPDAA